MILPPTKYFGDLANLVSHFLDSMGVENAYHGVVIGSLEEWRRRFQGWMTDSDKKAVQNSLHFFDLRPLKGDGSMLDELWDVLFSLLRKKELFLTVMASNIIKTSPPITAFKRFIVEKSGNNKGKFNILEKGIKPLVDIVRLYCLESGVKESDTVARISLLGRSQLAPYLDEIKYSYDYLSSLCLQVQYENSDKGGASLSWIKPDNLNRLEEKALKQIFSFIARLQVQLRQRHESTGF